jgi:hypothetical protein
MLASNPQAPGCMSRQRCFDPNGHHIARTGQPSFTYLPRLVSRRLLIGARCVRTILVFTALLRTFYHIQQLIMPISFVEPPPPGPAELMLIFLVDCVASTRMYMPTRDPLSGASYVVASAGDPPRMTLSDTGGMVIGTFAQPGFWQRARGQRGTIERAGAQGDVPVAKWLRPSASGPNGKRVIHINIAGQEHVWAQHTEHGTRGSLAVSVSLHANDLVLTRTCMQLWRGAHIVAIFRPSRSSKQNHTGAGEGAPCFADASSTVMRAHIVFTGALATPSASAVRDEALLSLIVVRQLARTAGMLGKEDSALADFGHLHGTA